jgi:hypothetical protein
VAVKLKKAPVAMPKAKKAPTPSKKPAKLVFDVVAIEEEGWEDLEEVVTQNRRGRQIRLLTQNK